LQRKRKRDKAVPPETRSRRLTPRSRSKTNISLWTEALFGAEILLLHATPVYYGIGVPHGDGSGVVIIPGFLGTDLYLMELHAWLGRIGYRAYFSGIGINAECPNLLIQRHLNETIETALSETGRKIHLIGHSLGGVIARSVAGQRPKDVASVITLAAPIRGTVTNKPFCARRKLFACAFFRNMAKGYCLAAIQVSAPATLLIACDARCRLPCSRPQSTRGTTVLWTGDTA